MLLNIQKNSWCTNAHLLDQVKRIYKIPINWAIDESSIKLDCDTLKAIDIVSYSKDLELDGVDKDMSLYEMYFDGGDNTVIEEFDEEIVEIEKACKVAEIEHELTNIIKLVPYDDDSSSGSSSSSSCSSSSSSSSSSDEEEAKMEIVERDKTNLKRPLSNYSFAADAKKGKLEACCFINNEAEELVSGDVEEEVELQNMEREELGRAKDFIDDNSDEEDDEFNEMSRNMYRILDNERLSKAPESERLLDDEGGGLEGDDIVIDEQIEDDELMTKINESLVVK